MNDTVSTVLYVSDLVWCNKCSLRGHVNKNKSKKTLEVGQVSNWKKKKLENIFYILFYYVFGRAFERQ